jgi:hypothetical protein
MVEPEQPQAFSVAKQLDTPPCRQRRSSRNAAMPPALNPTIHSTVSKPRLGKADPAKAPARRDPATGSAQHAAQAAPEAMILVEVFKTVSLSQD